MKRIYLIATVTALIAGLATYFFATQIAENSTLEDIQKYSVVVAIKDITADSVITADMIEVKELPYLSVTPGAVMTADSIIGRMTLYPIVAGEQILASKIVSVGVDSAQGRLSYELKPGQYAYTLACGLQASTSGFMREGDYVDVYYVGALDSNGYPASSGTQGVALLMENIKVMKLSSYSDNVAAVAAGTEILTYADATIIVDDEQLNLIMDARLGSGEVTFVLCPYVDGAGIADQVSDVTVEMKTVPIRVPTSEGATTAAEE